MWTLPMAASFLHPWWRNCEGIPVVRSFEGCGTDDPEPGVHSQRGSPSTLSASSQSPPLPLPYIQAFSGSTAQSASCPS
ncbi:hypothetical protein BJV77DRAFT_52028 [Russula vinacea]|nr:hypothetical protein BJV77DRAFT_52028 [Russula vinacea]